MSAAGDRVEEQPAIRILVCGTEGVLGEVMTRLIEDQPDMLLHAQVDDPVEALVAAGKGVDVLIMAAAEVAPLPGICSHLLMEYPHLRIVVVAMAGDQARLYWLGLRQRHIPALSAETLLRSIRDVYRVNPAA